MISEGLALMAVGMTGVFSFLAFLLVLMYGIAWFFQRFAHWFPDDTPAQQPGEQRKSGAHVRLAVAIAAAKAYQLKHKE